MIKKAGVFNIEEEDDDDKGNLSNKVRAGNFLIAKLPSQLIIISLDVGYSCFPYVLFK